MSEISVFVILTLLCIIMVKELGASSEAMKHITSGFLRVLDDCKHELNLTDHVIRDLYHYWKEDYSLLNRDTGCAILCMSKKLELIDSSGKLHHGNTKDFAIKHGAADEIASNLVGLLHSCEQEYETIGDDCSRVLEVAKCFRTGIRRLDWAPKMDVIITEVLTDI